MTLRFPQIESEPDAGVGDLFEIVDDQQQMTVMQHIAEHVGHGPLSGPADAERLGDGRRDEGGIGDRRQRHDRGAVGERILQAGGHLQGETGLADAAGTGQGEEANLALVQGLADRRQLPLTTEERSQREQHAPHRPAFRERNGLSDTCGTAWL